jgi:hypothetical protein
MLKRTARAVSPPLLHFQILQSLSQYKELLPQSCPPTDSGTIQNDSPWKNYGRRIEAFLSSV